MPKTLKFYAGVLSTALLAGSTIIATQSALAEESSSSTSTTLRPSSDVLSTETNRVSTGVTLSHVFNRTRSFALRRKGAPAAKTAALYSEFGSGVAAGDGNSGMTGFASLSFNNAEDDFVSTAYDSDTTSFSFGVDKSMSDKMIVGISAGYSSTDTSTTFNAGSSDTTGWNLAPYLSYVVNDMISLDASVGYSSSESDNSRVSAGTTITGTQDSSSKFASLGINAAKWMDNLGLSANAGYTWSGSDSDGFTESNGTVISSSSSTFKQIHLGGQVSYYTEKAMPYASLTWQKELGKERVAVAAGQATPSNDADELVLGLGLSFFGEGAVSGGISGSKTFSRDNFDGSMISANVSIAF
jgi:outer membrane autotransporter protein